MRQRGFTLVELMVVIALMAIIAIAFLGAFGVFSAGDPLRRSATEIKSVIEKGRSQALANASRFELLLDYERGEIHSWERRPITFFGFESDIGADNFFLEGNLHEKPTNYDSNLLAGSALAVWSGSPRFSVAEANEFVSTGDNDGLAISFDFLPQMGDGERIALLQQAKSWNIFAIESRNGIAYLAAEIQGIPYLSRVPLAIGEWSHVELVLSRVSPRFYVNGVLASVATAGSDNARLAEAMASYQSAELPIGEGPIVIGGAGSSNFMLDNLRIDKLAPLQVLELQAEYEVSLIPPGADISQTLNQELWGENDEGGFGNILPVDHIDPRDMRTKKALPRRAMIFFDEKGHLDSAIHKGAVNITLAAFAKDTSNGRQVVLEVSELGVVRELAEARQEMLKEPNPEERKKAVKRDAYGREIPISH